MSGKVPKRKPRPGVDEYGRQALHYAALRGDVVAIKSLLDAGADPNCADDNGYTPLHFAAQEKRAAVVSLLLARRADPSAADIHGNQPLWTAVMHAHGHKECAALLLQAGADRHHKNKAGRSPYDMAAAFGHDWKVVFGEDHSPGAPTA